jgi:hypothetical protein
MATLARRVGLGLRAVTSRHGRVGSLCLGGLESVWFHDSYFDATP